MFRKILKRSITFLVAALVLIGTVAMPVKAAYFESMDDQLGTVGEYSSLVKFSIEAENEDGDIINFNFPGRINDYQEIDGYTVSTNIISQDGEAPYSYSADIMYEEAVHAHPIGPSLVIGKTAYYKHYYDFWRYDDDSAERFVPYSMTFTFDDFIIPLSECVYGSTRFRLYIPEGWNYVVSYDYYFVYPHTYDVYYTTNILSEKFEEYVRGTGEGEHCELVREYAYHHGLDLGVSADSYVLISNAYIYMWAPDDYDGSDIDHYFYAGYSTSPLSVALFFTDNDIDFSEVVYVEKTVEVPVFDVGITNFLTDGVGGFLDADIFGTFSIGDLLGILLSVFFIIYLLKIIS